MLRQIRLLVFDLDYVIFDCAALKVKALRESLISFADDIPQDVRLPDAVDAWEGFREYGRRWPQHLELGIGEPQLEELNAAYQVYETRLVEKGAGRIYPGVPGMLDACRQIGLVSALGAEANRDYLLAVSDRHELETFFESAYCTEEFGSGGAEEMIEEIMSRAQVLPSETLVLGNRHDLFAAARNLDVITIGCEWGLQAPEVPGSADLRLLSPTAALAAIEAADAIAAQRHSA